MFKTYRIPKDDRSLRKVWKTVKLLKKSLDSVSDLDIKNCLETDDRAKIKSTLRKTIHEYCAVCPNGCAYWSKRKARLCRRRCGMYKND